MKKTNLSKVTQLFFVLMALSFSVISCRSGAGKTEKTLADTMALQKETENIFEHLLVDNQKDPSCGMPVTAGISDTAHYQDKVLGFCSKECKADFLKDPSAHLAAAEMKK